ncbi:hypothetical protein RDI58_024291 [Solanum bulbocastanum]|uniref:Uncharacterized protein n=1 Tax=Solanum bulbocastanum TaxID=147425 RepID=A0AAN8SX92_SOLBU
MTNNLSPRGTDVPVTDWIPGGRDDSNKGLCKDHVRLLVQSSVNSNDFVKYFRFLNIWTEHEDFLNCVRSSWSEGCLLNPMWNLQLKLEKIKARLSIWSREKYGDIYEDTKNIEKNIAEMEQNLILNNMVAEHLSSFLWARLLSMRRSPDK